MTTNVLATVLANLYSEGFGLPTENPDDDVTDKKDQDVSGTGMGEGVGLNDVSDQMIDEDQLLGANEKVCIIVQVRCLAGYCFLFFISQISNFFSFE